MYADVELGDLQPEPESGHLVHDLQHPRDGRHRHPDVALHPDQVDRCLGVEEHPHKALNLSTLIFGVGWLVFGMAIYVAYRRSQGLSLTQTVKAVQAEAIVEHEVEYESVLVAFEGGQYSAGAVATAAQLAARRRRGIHVLVLITVPPNSPIDAAMPEQEAEAGSIIDSARVRGGRRVTGHWEKVRPGQGGRRVVEEAREIRARAIVMALPPRRTGASLFGKTIETVLTDRPCRVIISSGTGPPAKRAA